MNKMREILERLASCEIEYGQNTTRRDYKKGKYYFASKEQIDQALKELKSLRLTEEEMSNEIAWRTNLSYPDDDIREIVKAIKKAQEEKEER